MHYINNISHSIQPPGPAGILICCFRMLQQIGGIKNHSEMSCIPDLFQYLHGSFQILQRMPPDRLNSQRHIYPDSLLHHPENAVHHKRFPLLAQFPVQTGIGRLRSYHMSSQLLCPGHAFLQRIHSIPANIFIRIAQIHIAAKNCNIDILLFKGCPDLLQLFRSNIVIAFYAHKGLGKSQLSCLILLIMKQPGHLPDLSPAKIMGAYPYFHHNSPFYIPRASARARIVRD